MFSHITLGCQDLELSSAFYDAVLSPLGLTRRLVTPDGGPLAACWIKPDQPMPRFYLYQPFDGKPASVGNGNMTAFSAPSVEAVDLAYAAAMSKNAQDEGQPGPRPHYGEGYYGAYLRDPTATSCIWFFVVIYAKPSLS